MNKNYIVIARIADTDYMTTVKAESLYSAEHAILDTGFCGRHEYCIDACMAYDENTMKTDTFIAHALSSCPVSHYELSGIICARNVYIQDRDAAEDRIRAIEKQMKELAKELEEAKRILAA